jgi:hypothetical protein
VFKYIIKHKPTAHRRLILSVYGVKKIYKLLLIYFLKLFDNYKISLFFLKFNLKYHTEKYKHLATLRKKSKKKLLKLESFKKRINYKNV